MIYLTQKSRPIPSKKRTVEQFLVPQKANEALCGPAPSLWPAFSESAGGKLKGFRAGLVSRGRLAPGYGKWRWKVPLIRCANEGGFLVWRSASS